MHKSAQVYLENRAEIRWEFPESKQSQVHLLLLLAHLFLFFFYPKCLLPGEGWGPLYSLSPSRAASLPGFTIIFLLWLLGLLT